MKRHLIMPLTIVSIVLLCAFSSQSSENLKPRAYMWWDYNGNGLGEMGYNWYYTPDPNNWPDCPLQAGLIYCEIYAAEDPDSDPGETRPDLSTITNYRMKLN